MIQSYCHTCYKSKPIPATTAVLLCKEQDKVVKRDNYCTLYQPVKYYPRGLYRTSNKARQAKQKKERE